jgi:protein-L-isoaspartate(D-aspartate) O-methyltransferase
VTRPPPTLLDQVADGGRLVAVVRNQTASRVTICRKFGTGFGQLTPFDAWLPELTALREREGFVF